MVRVHMSSGEVFQGRMFAVGQNRVWIDGAPGRIGLDGDRVEKIERLPDAVTEHNVSEQGAVGDLVRVQVPGGVLFGRVLSKVDDRVTLVTERGARVTLKDPTIEQIGSARVRLITE